MLFTRFEQGSPSSHDALIRKGRQQARDSGHSLFRGPARGRSPRARISIFAPLQSTDSDADSDNSSSLARSDHRAGFNFRR